MAPDFDPDGATGADEGLFGLPTSLEDARAVVVPVPFEATVSYGDGTVNGPAAILRASCQVDLYDAQTGKPYEHGIAMMEIPEQVRHLSDDARALAAPIIAAGGTGDSAGLVESARSVDAICERVNDWLYGHVSSLLAEERMAFVVGGDHSTPFGAIRACAERFPGLGILHVDAHYDLRRAYEGFTWSHASIMFNVLSRVPGVAKIVHVGIRDFCQQEIDVRAEFGDRTDAFLDGEVRDELAEGTPWRNIVDRMVEKLPQDVYVSFDIDGLDPVLCPGTGTPVPGVEQSSGSG